MRYIFFVEASTEVGYGHLYECLAISEYISKKDIKFLFFDSSDIAERIAREKGYTTQRIDGISLQNIELDNCECIIMNTRKNELSLQKYLKNKCNTLLLIDELGNKELDCDIIINFSICKEWLVYKFNRSPRQFFGADFYPLRKEFINANKKMDAQHNGKVLVSMGGADRTRTTLLLAELFSEIESPEFTYLIGPGFNFREEQIREKTKGKLNHKIISYSENIAEVMAKHSIIFSAGGNTLFEAAYLGVPTMIVWEDHHERIQGGEFANKGVSLLLGSKDEIKSLSVLNKLNNLMNNRVLYEKMAANAQALVDGKGCIRIANILEAA